jgi:hypothetical protein
MRLTLLSLVFLLSSICLTAQQKLPEWYRVYTFDESIIEMNTLHVTLDGDDVGRVRFRWTFDQPQPVKGERNLRYKSRGELWAISCSDKKYRIDESTLFDSAGEVIRYERIKSPGESLSVVSGFITPRLFEAACQLIKKRGRPPAVVSTEKIELEKATLFAFSFAESLQKAKDFKPIIKKFFVPDYLDGYLSDADMKWFPNLSRELVAKLRRAELERFYVAYLNAGFLSCLYVVSKASSVSGESIPDRDLVPPDVVKAILNHPYTARYKRESGNFDYLDESIDNVERFRIYTNLLEHIAALMRKHAKRVEAGRTMEYKQQILSDAWDIDLYDPERGICQKECFGLPVGTRLFEVNVPVFHLQIAEIRGQLKVVSAVEYFR